MWGHTIMLFLLKTIKTVKSRALLYKMTSVVCKSADARDMKKNYLSVTQFQNDILEIQLISMSVSLLVSCLNSLNYKNRLGLQNVQYS